MRFFFGLAIGFGFGLATQVLALNHFMFKLWVEPFDDLPLPEYPTRNKDKFKKLTQVSLLRPEKEAWEDDLRLKPVIDEEEKDEENNDKNPEGHQDGWGEFQIRVEVANDETRKYNTSPCIFGITWPRPIQKEKAL